MVVNIVLTAIWAIAVAVYCVIFGSSELWTDPDKIADFLAGALAPPALIWIASAVFLQRAELRAQRMEIVLNRQTLELQRIELSKAAAEMRKQSEALDALHKMRLSKELSETVDILYGRFLAAVRAELALLIDLAQMVPPDPIVDPVLREIRILIESNSDEKSTHRLSQIIGRDNNPFLQLAALASSNKRGDLLVDAMEALNNIITQCAEFERHVMRLTADFRHETPRGVSDVRAEIGRLRNSVVYLKAKAASKYGTNEHMLQ